MRQRLGIADALVKDPSVLILDEPTIAIDPAGVEELLALLRRMVRERNLTVLLSSHILGQVQSLCDRVGFFASGRMVAAGPLDELARGTDAMPHTELEVGVEGDPAAIDAIASKIPGVVTVAPHERDEHLRVVTASTDVAAPAGDRARGGKRPARPPATPRHRPAGALPTLRPGGSRWHPLTCPAPTRPGRPAAPSGHRRAAGGRSPPRSSAITCPASGSSCCWS